MHKDDTLRAHVKIVRGIITPDGKWKRVSNPITLLCNITGLETLVHSPHRDVNPGAIKTGLRPDRTTCHALLYGMGNISGSSRKFFSTH
ncbi:MAG TPA: hypothetical protein PLP19_10380 [bacterium]|nr:hypothetical protein [bacterium]HPN43885.1 hypothetical protein [bacterium]